MTYKMGPKGQVVVPKALRERAGMHPGSAVEFEWVNGRVMLAPAVQRPLGGRFGGTGMAARLLEDRASEPR